MHIDPTSDTNLCMSSLQLKYHEDFETNIKGKKTQVVDDPETMRHKQVTSIISQVDYQGHHQKQAEMEARRRLVDTGTNPCLISWHVVIRLFFVCTIIWFSCIVQYGFSMPVFSAFTELRS